MQSQQLNTHTESDPLLDVKTTIRQQDDEVEVVVKDKDDDDVECGFSCCCCCCCCQAVCYQVSSTYHKLQHVLSVYWSFGLIAFGGTSVHIAIFRDQLVRVKAWMDDEVFMELFALGQSLPGPSSTQLVISSASTQGGVLGGLLAFVLWILPGFVVLTISGLFLKHYVVMEQELDTPSSSMVTSQQHHSSSSSSSTTTTTTTTPIWLLGVPPAAVSLLFKASFGFVKTLDRYGLALGLISCVVSIWINGDQRLKPTCSQVVYPALLLMGAVATLVDFARGPQHSIGTYYRPPPPRRPQRQHDVANSNGSSTTTTTTTAADDDDDEDYEAEEKLRAERDLKLKQQIGITIGQGSVFLITWFVILVTVVVLVNVSNASSDDDDDKNNNNKYLRLFDILYRIGSLLFGGGIVMIPMAHSELVETRQWLTDEQFFQGLGLTQSLPGPICNFGAFLGAMVTSIGPNPILSGLWGSVVAELALFGPGVLWIFAMIPVWSHTRHLAWFKALLKGLNTSAIGLIVGGCIFLYAKSVHTAADAMVFVLAGGLAGLYDVQAPFVIASGAVLGALFSPALLNIGQKEYH